jgi:uncharacterized protein (DUF1015 family)
MVVVRPFKAIRPTRDKANLVASRSYLSYSEETIKEKLDHNPYTFLHIINPDYKTGNKASGVGKFQLIKKKFEKFITDGILRKDNEDAFYIYQKKDDINTFTGIIGSCLVKDYLDQSIKKHEQTLTKREQVFREYLDTTGFNADPVLLSHEPNSKIKEIIKKYTGIRSEYEFTTTNKSLHKLWVVNSPSDINTIASAFDKIEHLYIADGHHRCASSALLSASKNTEASPYFMSYLIDESQLSILNFNRLIKHLNGLKTSELLDKIREKYSVTQKKLSSYSPTLEHEISMYLGGIWYSLVSNEKHYNSISDSLDPSILSKNILKPILNIIDERVDKNISFFDGKISLSDLKEKVDSGEYKIAFILKPITIDAIKKVADNNETMPPKSTYVEPKLRSGLTIYPID